MNERIEELEAQCWEPKQYGPPWFNSQKFAELIVRECAKISEQSQWTEAKGEYYEGFNEAMTYVSNKIKEHFGVES
jgi:hypothetical protein